MLCMEAVQEFNLPKVKGTTVQELPENLYIPPKALLLLLDVFSGPMDFLLYLIQRKNLDILEIDLVELQINISPILNSWKILNMSLQEIISPWQHTSQK